MAAPPLIHAPLNQHPGGLDLELGLGPSPYSPTTLLVAIDCDVVNSVSLQCSEDIRHSYFSLSREVSVHGVTQPS